MDKFEKAKRIMLESGWMNKYHFIINVMNGNATSKILRHETRTIIWGCEVLKQHLNMLKRKHPKYSEYFDKIEAPYYDSLRNLHECIMDKIINNSYDDGNKETANDCN